MSRQDKATSERHTKILRELVKRPENKLCADCKRNDPRWASWNLGVFVCIRCSGIHRSMGTHISKVKSVDLDIWTPDQMASIQKWGNRRANLYWEAHLKTGHVPPDHKMESFIRSKYESRRWAIDGPPPSDPSILEQVNTDSAEQEAAQAPEAAPSQAPQYTAPNPTSSAKSARALISPVTATANRQGALPTRGQPQALTNQPAPVPAPQKPADDLFSLDFHAPAPTSNLASNASSSNGQPKDVKNDIMSLFSNPVSAAPAGPTAFGNVQGVNPATSMAGTTGAGMWGVSSGWSAPVQPASTDVWGSFASAPTQPGPQQMFGAAPQQSSMFSTPNMWSTPAQPAPMAGANVWASTTTTTNGTAGASNDPFGSFGAAPPQQKKDDAFGDLWGGFK